MKCPYCNEEMELGYIQCRDGVTWTPKRQLVAALSGLGRGSVSLANGAPNIQGLFLHTSAVNVRKSLLIILRMLAEGVLIYNV